MGDLLSRYRTIIFAVVAAIVVAVLFIAAEQFSAGSPWSHIFSSSILGAVMIALNIIFSIVTVIGLLAWANVELSALTAMTCLVTVRFAYSAFPKFQFDSWPIFSWCCRWDSRASLLCTSCMRSTRHAALALKGMALA